MWLALGLAILANSRPYEGFLLGVATAICLAMWLFGAERPTFSNTLRKVFVPVILILAVTALATGYYYKRVTGDPFRMTYQVNRRTYSRAPYFLWQSPRPEPVYRHAVMRQFYQREFKTFEESRTLTGFLYNTGKKIGSLWDFYLGPVLTIPLLALPWIFRDRRMRFPLIACVVLFLGMLVETWTSPHYLAAATGLLYLVLMQCMRHLRLWRWRGQPLGLSMVRAIPLICFAMIVLRVTAVAAHTPIESAWPRGNLERAAIVRQLEDLPGQHLVIVRYGPDHDLEREWVFNAATSITRKSSGPATWARWTTKNCCNTSTAVMYGESMRTNPLPGWNHEVRIVAHCQTDSHSWAAACGMSMDDLCHRHVDSWTHRSQWSGQGNRFLALLHAGQPRIARSWRLAVRHASPG